MVTNLYPISQYCIFFKNCNYMVQFSEAAWCKEGFIFWATQQNKMQFTSKIRVQLSFLCNVNFFLCSWPLTLKMKDLFCILYKNLEYFHHILLQEKEIQTWANFCFDKLLSLSHYFIKYYLVLFIFIILNLCRYDL